MEQGQEDSQTRAKLSSSSVPPSGMEGDIFDLMPLHGAGAFQQLEEDKRPDWPPGTRPIPVAQQYVIRDTGTEGGFLAEAGQGSVWAAMDDKGTHLAIKVVNLEHKERVQNVLKKIGELPTHPNVIKILDGPFEIKEGLAYVMREAQWSLREYITTTMWKGHQPLDCKLLELLAGPALGLDFLNSHGIRHRDIKPDNILEFADGSVVLSDLDLAIIDAKPVETGRSRAGTSGFISTEADKGQYTFRSDQVGLGRTYLALRTGDPNGSIANQKEADIVSKAINTDSLSRCNSCFDFIRELLSVLSDEARAKITMPSLVRALPTKDHSDDDWSRQCEREYTAFVREGLYDRAIVCAIGAFNRSHNNHMRRVQWANHAASAYRASGDLANAELLYASAEEAYKAEKAKGGDNIALHCHALRSRFGQIIVGAFLTRGALKEAYESHGTLLNAINELQNHSLAGPIQDAINARIPHVLRQRAEMLRLLGHYSESLGLIRETMRLYREADVEPMRYSKLCEADSLRLLGDFSGAIAIYEGLEAEAHRRELALFHIAVLWRQASLYQAQGNSEKAWDCVDKLLSITAPRSHFTRIYALLISASGRVRNAQTAMQLLDTLTIENPMSEDFRSLEYAHMCLCRAELYRHQQSNTESGVWFSKALNVYHRGQCKWGCVRSYIGILLSGGTEVPAQVASSLEGSDAILIKDYIEGKPIPVGMLSAGIP